MNQKREKLFEIAWKVTITVIGSLGCTLLVAVLVFQADLAKRLSDADTQRTNHEIRIKALEAWGPNAGERVTQTDLGQLMAGMRDMSDKLADVRETVARIDERTLRSEP